MQNLQTHESTSEISMKIKGLTMLEPHQEIVHKPTVVDSQLKREGDFIKNVYFEKIQSININQVGKPNQEAISNTVKMLEQLGDQTNKLKSIIEDVQPNRDDDMPILQYADTSEYIVHGFDSNENMTTLEIFTDKWERYTKERGSKDMYKECLKEEYQYNTNRIPDILTAKFSKVKDVHDEERVKAYVTVFYPTEKIGCILENQRYADVEKTPVSTENLVVFGLLSPLWPGEIPDLKFYTNNLRSSHGFNYTVKTIDKPLYIKDFSKVEYFMTTIMRDIYKQNPSNMFPFHEEPTQFDSQGEEVQRGLPKFKNYMFVPINMKTSLKFPEDIIDWAYIDRIKEIHEKGICSKYPSLHTTLTETLDGDVEKFMDYLKQHIFIKGNKPHWLYTNPDLILDLRKVDGTEFSDLLKVNIGNKKFTSAFDLIDSNKLNASTVRWFRDYCIGEKYMKYMTSPVLVCDQIKNPNTLKLRLLPVDLAIKHKKKIYTESKPPGVSGRPIMSIFDMYPYFMSIQQWKHCWFLPVLCTHFERCAFVSELIHSVGLYTEPKYVFWATSSSATSSEINYEPLETYGDTILKFAASWISYEFFKNDPEAGENEICERRNCFVTNKELFRLGISLNLRRYIRTMDGDVGNWVPPYVGLKLKIKPHRNYFVETKFNGKHIADWVESLIAAYLLSGGIKHALTFVSKIGAVPLDKSGLLDKFPDNPSTINTNDLDQFVIKIDAKWGKIFKEYCRIHKPNKTIINTFKKCVAKIETEPLGSAYKNVSSKYFFILSTKLCKLNLFRIFVVERNIIWGLG